MARLHHSSVISWNFSIKETQFLAIPMNKRSFPCLISSANNQLVPLCIDFLFLLDTEIYSEALYQAN